MNLTAQLNQNELQVVTTEIVLDYIRLKEKERRQQQRYYSLTEAMNTLDIKSKKTFYKYVREHKIPKKHGSYCKRSIDNLANQLMR